MGFSKKIKAYFKGKGLTSKAVSEIMDGYNTNMISRCINTDEISAAFLSNLIKYFPDVDLNYLLKDDTENNLVQENSEKHITRTQNLIEEIREKLNELEKICHKSDTI